MCPPDNCACSKDQEPAAIAQEQADCHIPDDAECPHLTRPFSECSSVDNEDSAPEPNGRSNPSWVGLSLVPCGEGSLRPPRRRGKKRRGKPRFYCEGRSSKSYAAISGFGSAAAQPAGLRA